MRDQASGKPLAGVTVGAPQNFWDCRLKTVTDKEGRYELIGLPQNTPYRILAKPADGLHFQRAVSLKGTPGLGVLICDVNLVRGLTARGRVTNKETGQPIPGVQVDYHPLGGNDYVNKLLPGQWDPISEATTDADGSYVLTVMPGPGVIGVRAPELDSFMPAALSLQERKEFFKTPLVNDKDEQYLAPAAGGGKFGRLGLHFYNVVTLLEPGEKEETLVRDVALEKRPSER